MNKPRSEEDKHSPRLCSREGTAGVGIFLLESVSENSRAESVSLHVAGREAGVLLTCGLLGTSLGPPGSDMGGGLWDFQLYLTLNSRNAAETGSRGPMV